MQGLAVPEFCRIIVREYKSSVPSDIETLTSFPGIGRKTANIILGNAFGQPAVAVDTHVQRVSNRLGLAASKNADNIEKELCGIIPKGKWTKICHLFQAHGRAVCSAKKPACPDCILFDLCKWKEKTG